MDNNELKHYGVPGMKWGVRRARRTPHEDYTRAHKKTRISEMSDAELKSRNNRLNAEKQYRELIKRSGYGKRAVQAFIETAGTITAATAAYATYKKFGKQALDAIRDRMLKDIKF